jgi:hypothetical protein
MNIYSTFPIVLGALAYWPVRPLGQDDNLVAYLATLEQLLYLAIHRPIHEAITQEQEMFIFGSNNSKRIVPFNQTHNIAGPSVRWCKLNVPFLGFEKAVHANYILHRYQCREIWIEKGIHLFFRKL